jgi:prevent-host-death family protein
MEVNVKAAQTQFSRLIKAVQDGETIFITSHGKRVAQIIPATSKDQMLPNKGFGIAKEMLKDLPDDWDSPAEKAKIRALFEGLK